MKKKQILFGLMIAIFLAGILSLFASPWPDGLEKVAEEKGFLDKEVESVFPSPLPDYSWPGIKSEKLARSFAGIFGTLLVFVSGYVIADLIRDKTR